MEIAGLGLRNTGRVGGGLLAAPEAVKNEDEHISWPKRTLHFLQTVMWIGPKLKAVHRDNLVKHFRFEQKL